MENVMIVVIGTIVGLALATSVLWSLVRQGYKAVHADARERTIVRPSAA